VLRILTGERRQALVNLRCERGAEIVTGHPQKQEHLVPHHEIDQPLSGRFEFGSLPQTRAQYRMQIRARHIKKDANLGIGSCGVHRAEGRGK
jgi:hypothetical protein